MSSKFAIPHYDDHPAYKRSPVVETICRIDFPPILNIATDVPSAFQNKIRADYPMYEIIKPDLIIPLPGQTPQDPVLLNNHQFVSESGLEKVNITKDFFAFSTMNYKGWKSFIASFYKAFAAFRAIYDPSSAIRIGIKYTNFLPEQLLIRDNKPLCHYVKSQFIAPLENLSFMESPIAAYSGTCEILLPDDAIARVNYGLGTIIDLGSRMFYIETDVFSQKNRLLSEAAGALELFHNQSYDVFRWVITEDLHEYFSHN